MAMNAVRKQRLIILSVITFAVALAVGLGLLALGENINHFYTPKQIAAGEAPVGKNIRVGGLVVAGSVKRGEGLEVQFELTDNAGTITVLFDGILPDLFREGQGIVGTGMLREDGIVVAHEVLAKHDENYMPPEVQHAIDQAGHPTDMQESL